MGKRGASGDAQKLKALQLALRKKMEAEAATVTSPAGVGAAASTEATEVEMPPPKVPRKDKKQKKEKKEKKEQSGSKEPAIEKKDEPELTEKDLEAAVEAAMDAAVAAGDVAATEPKKLKRLRHVECEPEARPKAKAKAMAKEKKPDPQEPPFDITWENHSLLMKHFQISEDEATSCLLQVIGPDDRYKKFWGKFSVDAKDSKDKGKETSEPTAKTKDAVAAQSDDDDGTEFYGGGPMTDNGDDDDDVDGDTASTSSGGTPPRPPPPPAAAPVETVSSEPVIDQMETQPMEVPEPVIQHIPSKPDDAEVARRDFAEKVKSAPTPAKALEKQALVWEHFLW